MAAGCRANLDLEAEKLNCEIAELENSVKHLRRSNEELDAALEESPGDEDFAAARQENDGVIARKEALLAELRKELQGLKASLVQAMAAGTALAAAAMELSGPVPVPVSVAGAEAGAAAAAAAQQQQQQRPRQQPPAAGAASSGPQLLAEEEEGKEIDAGGVYL